MVFRALYAAISGIASRLITKRWGTRESFQKLSEIGTGEFHVMNARANLWDCDINGHVNNSSYVYMGELARWHLCGLNGLLGTVIQNKWSFIVGSQSFRYRRAIPPLAKYQVWTIVDSIDDRWMYMTHTFTSPVAKSTDKPDIVYAQALVRAIIMPPKRGMTLTPSDVLASYGVTDETIKRLLENKPEHFPHVEGFLDWDSAADQNMKSFPDPPLVKKKDE